MACHGPQLLTRLEAVFKASVKLFMCLVSLSLQGAYLRNLGEGLSQVWAGSLRFGFRLQLPKSYGALRMESSRILGLG